MLESVFGFLVPKKEFANSVVPESANRDLEGKLGENTALLVISFMESSLSRKTLPAYLIFPTRKWVESTKVRESSMNVLD